MSSLPYLISSFPPLFLETPNEYFQLSVFSGSASGGWESLTKASETRSCSRKQIFKMDSRTESFDTQVAAKTPLLVISGVVLSSGVL